MVTSSSIISSLLANTEIEEPNLVCFGCLSFVLLDLIDHLHQQCNNILVVDTLLSHLNKSTKYGALSTVNYMNALEYPQVFIEH